ncbi:MAG: XdhC family protein, partial [Pseudomonadota bacterium]
LTNLVATVRALGYGVHAHSPEAEALEVCRRLGAETSPLTSVRDPLTFDDDEATAIVLAFHDHEWEPMLLKAALQTPAFWIGAVGSAVTHAERLMKLRAAGEDENGVARVRGTIGLIGRARDPRILAASILADVLATRQTDAAPLLYRG